MSYNLRSLEEGMKQIVERLQEEYSKMRTGRATSVLVEDIKTPYHGMPTPLKRMANIAVPEGNMIVIQPWDKSQLGEIEKAIRESGKGLEPTNDGIAVRVSIPPLTADRRANLIKMINMQAEEAKVALRTLRQKQWQELLDEVRAGKATEDDKYRSEKEVNDLTRKYNGEVDKLVQTKSAEIEKI